MTNSFCPWCGSQVGETFTFCRKCGKTLQDSEPEHSDTHPISGPLLTSIPTTPARPASGDQVSAPSLQAGQASRVSTYDATTIPRARPTTRLAAITTIIIVAVVIVVVLAAIELQPKTVSANGSTPPGLTDANPYNMSAFSVTGAVTYEGTGSGYLGSFQGGDICPQCPVIPTPGNLASVKSEWFNDAPANASGFVIYFNVTNTGNDNVNLLGFNLSTNDAPDFAFQFNIACWTPLDGGYWSGCGGFGPGYTEPFVAVIWSTDIPKSVSGGYTLTLIITASETSAGA
jgi:hypothetical protein